MTLSLARCEFIGVCPAGDVYDYGFWAVQTDPAPAADFLNSAIAFTNKFWLDQGFRINNGFRETRVKVSVVNVATGKDIATGEASSTNAGASSTDSLPQEVAVVCTLRTALASRSGHGRFYLIPPHASGLTADGLLDATYQGDWANTIRDAFGLFTAVSGAIPVVYSRRLRAFNACNEIQIGNVFDVQRRRRNRLIEGRESRTI